VKRLTLLGILAILLVALITSGCTSRASVGISVEKAIALVRPVAEAYNQAGRPNTAKLDLAQGSATEADGSEAWYVRFPYHGGGGGMSWAVDRKTGKVSETPMTWDPKKP
jgi:hypothetical protein